MSLIERNRSASWSACAPAAVVQRDPTGPPVQVRAGLRGEAVADQEQGGHRGAAYGSSAQDETVARAAGSRTVNVDPRFSSLTTSTVAAVVLGDVLHDRQPEPRAAGLARTSPIDAIEPLEHPRQVPRRDAHAVVGDDQLHPAVAALQRHRDRPAGARVADRVVDQVADQEREVAHRTRDHGGSSIGHHDRQPGLAARPPRSGRLRRGPPGRTGPGRPDRCRTRAATGRADRRRSARAASLPARAERRTARRRRDRGRPPTARVSATAWIEAAGVFSSCEAFATKSRRTASMRRVSVMSVTTNRTEPSLPAGAAVARNQLVGSVRSSSIVEARRGAR